MRRRRKRRINHKFTDIYFKPRGIPLKEMDVTIVSSIELEAMRLRYLEKLSQIDSASKMNISQSQYQRDLVGALQKITDALINKKAIVLKNDDE